MHIVDVICCPDVKSDCLEFVSVMWVVKREESIS